LVNKAVESTESIVYCMASVYSSINPTSPGSRLRMPNTSKNTKYQSSYCKL